MRYLKIGAFACVAAVAACSSDDNNNAVVIPTPTVDASAVIDAAENAIDAAKNEIDAAENAIDAAKQADAATASTFTQVYGNIISPICVQCHNPQGIGVTIGKLDMSTKAAAFTDLVGVSAMGMLCGGMGTRVIAGNAANSILFKKVDPNQGSPCGSKMPLGLTPLTTAQANEIETWINAGAMNN
jgi:hypothetical protein